MQLLGSDVTLPIFEQEPRQSQTLACWPEIHRPQALQHVRWGRHHIHIANIGRVMAEINNYVAAGGRRSVNALSPQPGPDLRTATSAIWNVTYRSWLTLSGVSVTGSPTWRPACPLSHPTKPRRAGLLPAASHQVRNILSRQPKRQTIAIALGNLGNVGLGDLLVSGGAICDPGSCPWRLGAASARTG